MTEQLREAFRDLAEEAVTPADLSPRDLWRRGRRARRARTASAVLTAAVALAVVGILLPGAGDPTRTTRDPASYDEGELAVPDHIWAPSSWAPSTGAGDRPGPLALVGEAARREPWLLTTSDGWFGVSAVDQSYVWLDLPGRERSEGSDVALSSDGRWIGYFVSGEPPSGDAQSDVVGYAALDTVTGEVHRREVPTEYGLAPYALLWSPDSERLVVSYGQYLRREGASNRGAVTAWHPGTDDAVPLDTPALHGPTGVGLGGVITCGGREGQVVVWDTDTGAARRIAPAPEMKESGCGDSISANPSGTMLAMRTSMRAGRGSTTWGLRVGRLEGDGVTDVRLVNRRWQLNRVLGWLDDRRVLGEAHRRGGDGIDHVAFDTTTGDADRVIGRTDPRERWLQPRFAMDLLQRPFVEGVEPPSPWHPWWPGMVALGVLAGGLVLSQARNRRRR